MAGLSITFLTPAETIPPLPQDTSDFHLPLSPRGYQKAGAVSCQLDKKFDAVILSRAQGSMETSQPFMSGTGTQSSMQIFESDLYIEPDTKFGKMLDEIPEPAPGRAQLHYTDINVGNLGVALKSFGRETWRKILGHLRRTNITSGNVLVIADAVLITAIGIEITDANKSSPDASMNLVGALMLTQFNYCEGFTIIFGDDGKPIELDLHKTHSAQMVA